MILTGLVVVTALAAVVAPASAATRLASARSAAPTAYYHGVLYACQTPLSGTSTGCDTSPGKWYVIDSFYFTVDFGTGQFWNNGTPDCGQHQGTDVDWCSWDYNGTPQFTEGFNFDQSNDYARITFSTGNIGGVNAVIYSVEPFNSWENVQAVVTGA